MPSFLETLRSRVLVCDAAMGTALYAKGAFVNRSFDELNLTQPDLVTQVHLENVGAGADVIETNTFGANRVKLAPFGLTDRLHAINVEGVRVARQAARDRAFVAGAIGPLGVRVEPWGKTGLDEAEALFVEQARALHDGGVDLFILETFRDARELLAAISAVRQVCGLPVVAQMTTDEDGNALDGASPEAFGPALEGAGADVVGLNCSVGPAGMLETLERLRASTTRPLSAQPNAGRPREIEGRAIYLSSPEYMASYARRFVDGGVRLVGGCCGTTPEHVAAIRAAIRARPVPLPEAARVTVAMSRTAEAPAPVAVSDKSRLANRLGRGSFVVVAEVLPPRGDRRDELIERAQLLKIRDIDAIAVSDAILHGGRMSALASAIVIEQYVGIETILEYASRDRALLEVQSDLLGVHAIGLRNVLLVSGEALPRSATQDAPVVPDIDSIGLTNLVARLNQGLDVGGQPIGHPTGLLAGVAARPDAVDVDREQRRLELKVEAGAEFIVTTPVFDVGRFDAWHARVRHLGVPILARLHAFDSVRDAEYMANEVPGISVPAALVDRLRRAPHAADEGQAIAVELASALRIRVQGLQVDVGAGPIDGALTLIDRLAEGRSA